MIRIDVSDSGPGIEEKHQPHIFDRFYQISNKTASGTISTGIGLSLSKDLVESHYGEIRFSSQLNKGTTFSIFLPKSDEHLKPEEISNESGIDYSFEYMKSMLESPAYSDNDKIIGLTDNEGIGAAEPEDKEAETKQSPPEVAKEAPPAEASTRRVEGIAWCDAGRREEIRRNSRRGAGAVAGTPVAVDRVRRRHRLPSRSSTGSGTGSGSKYSRCCSARSFRWPC